MTQPDRAAIHALIRDRQGAHLERIADFVRIPSISPERRAIAEGADFVAESLRLCGCADAQVLDLGDGFPGVFGSIDEGVAETLLIYSHYDVRVVGPEKWTDDPFSGAVKSFGGYPKVVMGRGAAAKAPLQAFCNAVGAIRAVAGRLPVNLVFLIEGAEILGSPNFPALVEARLADVRRATALYGPRVGQDAAGTVSVILGYKGLICFELVASGKAWGSGPQGAAVHSATNAVVESPAWRLVQALACLHDGEKILVPELEAALAPRKPIAGWEEAPIAALAARVASASPDAVLPGLAPAAPIRRFRDGATGRALLEKYLYGPSFNISGLRSGYTGPGTRTLTLPEEARASIDMRVVCDVPADELVKMLRAHLDARGFPDVAIDLACAYDAHQVTPDASLPRAALETLAASGHASTIWPMQAFGGPWAHYGRVLGIPFLFGAAPGFGGRAATSDEFFVVDGGGKVAGLAELERWFVDLLYRVGGSA
jgi:acetylornithine deacetylase/succinyl-diaminopimelate desuccinylase-like protein